MIVNRVKELREKRMNEDDNSGIWTQEALAKRVGVTRQTIIAVERGTYNPSLELAFRLAAEFEISIEEIFNYGGRVMERRDILANAAFLVIAVVFIVSLMIAVPDQAFHLLIVASATVAVILLILWRAR